MGLLLHVRLVHSALQALRARLHAQLVRSAWLHLQLQYYATEATSAKTESPHPVRPSTSALLVLRMLPLVQVVRSASRWLPLLPRVLLALSVSMASPRLALKVHIVLQASRLPFCVHMPSSALLRRLLRPAVNPTATLRPKERIQPPSANATRATPVPAPAPNVRPIPTALAALRSARVRLACIRCKVRRISPSAAAQ